MSDILFTTPAVVTAQFYGSVRMFDFTSDKMDVDASSLVKAGARKLHGGAVGLYGLFDKDNAIPAGKRGKFEEDVEMKLADNVPGKSSFARLKKRVRSLRALAKSKLMPSKMAKKAGQLMDIDYDLNAAPATYPFTFSSPRSHERAREGQDVATQPVISTPSLAVQSTSTAINGLALSPSRVHITSTTVEDRSGDDTGSIHDQNQGKVRESALDAEGTSVSLTAKVKEGQHFSAVPIIMDMMERYWLEAASKAQAVVQESGIHPPESDTAPAALDDSENTHNLSSVIALEESSQACGTEVAITRAKLKTADNDTLPQEHDVEPSSSSLSLSISSLTVVSADDDDDGSLYDTGDRSAPEIPTSSDILWAAREPSPITPDEDEQKPQKIFLASEDGCGVGSAPADDSMDILVALFSKLSCHEEPEIPLTSVKDEAVPEPAPASDSNDTLVSVFVELSDHEEDSTETSSAKKITIACPAPADNAIDTLAALSDDQLSSPSVPALPVSRTPAQAVADPVSAVDEQEDHCEAWFDASDGTEGDEGDEDEDETWYDASDANEDEEEIETWHECEHSFEAVDDDSVAPAQFLFPQHDFTVLPGGLYDRDNELNIDLAGDFRIVCAHLTPSITRLGEFVTSWLGRSF